MVGAKTNNNMSLVSLYQEPHSITTFSFYQKSIPSQISLQNK